MKTAEIIAKEMLDIYLKGNSIVPGFPIDIAAKKAAAAHPNFRDDIYKIAEKLKEKQKF